MVDLDTDEGFDEFKSMPRPWTCSEIIYTEVGLLLSKVKRSSLALTATVPGKCSESAPIEQGYLIW